MSFTESKIISSPQDDVHKNLAEAVEKHLQTQFNRPIAKHNQAAFLEAHEYWHMQDRPKVILDSGCGTAESTHYLAANFPDHLVIGIDQSEKRLSNSNNHHTSDNCLLIRCECVDFWQLAEKEHWHFDQHFLFYPNPWPKPQHLKRRWHGHPVFPSLLNISKKIELRTNWEIYAKEFLTALDLAKVYQANCIEYQAEKSISAFEKKYTLSGHTLWQVKATI